MLPLRLPGGLPGIISFSSPSTSTTTLVVVSHWIAMPITSPFPTPKPRSESELELLLPPDDLLLLRSDPSRSLTDLLDHVLHSFGASSCCEPPLTKTTLPNLR